MSQHLELAIGCLNRLRPELEARGVERVFLVTGRASFDSSHLRDEILEGLAQFEVDRFFDFETNPKCGDLERGVGALARFEPDAIVACGGGSVMDMAKLLKAYGGSPAGITERIEAKDPVDPIPIPLFAIPTTAGSGSESTPFAVVWVRDTKYSIVHPELLPSVAIVDARFARDCPPRLRAACGLDALGQSIESYWSIHSTEASRNLSSEAIPLLARFLEAVVRQPTDGDHEQMSKAANLAGRAVAITKTTAPHAVSYPMTAHFGVPHGLAVGLTLPEFLLFNEGVSEDDCNDSRGPDFVRDRLGEIAAMTGTKGVRECAGFIRELMKRIGAPVTLTEAGIENEADRALIVANGFNPDRVKNNPRELTVDELKDILSAIR